MSGAAEMAAMASRLKALGYNPIDLRPAAGKPKGLPPKGRTGYAGVNYSVGELAEVNWDRKRLAVRLPSDVAGVDVDAYHGGLDGLAELEEKFGPLPLTVMSHNGRNDGSGIRLFRVPNGSTFATDPAVGIDMVQWFHRYVIAAPTVHPDGRRYAWYDQAEEADVELPPEVGELPDLPWKWIQGLAAAKGKKAEQAATPEEVQAFLAEHSLNKRPKALKAVEKQLAAATSGHDTAMKVACWMFREAAAGMYPARRALAVLEAWWERFFAARQGRKPSDGELSEIVLWAIAETLADTDRVTELRDEVDKDEPSARDVLLGMVADHYRIGRTDDERTFLAPNVGPNVALFSGAAKAELAHRMHKQSGSVPPRAALDETWMAVEGEALEATKEEMPLRVAWHEGAIVVDLGDTTGRAIVVTAGHWEIVDRSPVTFRRSKAMLPLDVPVRGGTTEELFELINVGAGYRPLFTAWIVSTFFQSLPHPAAVLRGQQGAAKTSAARGVTRLADPCMASTQKPPKAEEDWSQTCTARWIVAVDNVSKVSEWWSDALCRAVTGDGWLRRALYTDDEVVATSYRRCIILNGIALGSSLRSDLAERLIIFELERPSEWLTEREVDARLDDMRPRVLGAVLDQAAATLAELDNVETPRDLRMADFAHLLAAYDKATGSETLAAYRAQVDSAFAESLEGDALASAVITFMRRFDYSWQGRAADLLTMLDDLKPASAKRSRYGEDEHGKGDDDTPKDWPKTASHLVQAMNRCAPLLYRAGIKWHTPTRNRHGSVLYMTWMIDPNAPEGDECDGGDGDPPFVVTFDEDARTSREAGIAERETAEQQQGGHGRHRRHSSHEPALARDAEVPC